MVLSQFFWKALILVFGFSCIPISSFSQQVKNKATSKKTRKIRPAYLDFSLGINSSSFRDHATSPIIYSGRPLSISVAHSDVDQTRESTLRLSYSFGQFTNTFNRHTASSQVRIAGLRYLELFHIPRLSSEKIDFNIGGQFNSTVVFRDNESLLNNSEGLDILASLSASMKVTLDLSRLADEKKKFLFLTYTAKKRKRDLSIRFNVGMMNGAYRNGFAYLGQGAMLNNDEFFESYELKPFSGFRLSSTLAYTVFLPNTNAIRFSYLWDVYSTGGDASFEMANHLFALSFLFALK